MIITIQQIFKKHTFNASFICRYDINTTQIQQENIINKHNKDIASTCIIHTLHRIGIK